MAIDNNLAATFFRHPKPVDPKTNNGKDFVDSIYIKIRARGMKAIHSREMKEKDKEDFPTAWKRFQDEDTPIDGTPLKYLPGINQVVVQEMAILDIYTIEEIASLQEAALISVPRGRKWQRVAKAYLSARDELGKDDDDDEDFQIESAVDTAALMNDPDVVQLEPKPKKKVIRKKRK